MNLNVNVAGNSYSTPVWVAVPLKDPSGAIAISGMLNEASPKVRAVWCAAELGSAEGVVDHCDILKLRSIRRDAERVVDSDLAVVVESLAGVASSQCWPRDLASL